MIEGKKSMLYSDQIKKIEEYDFPEGKVRVIDIKPAGYEKNDPILFVPGWLGTFLKYESTVREIFEDGRRVISVEYPRYGGDAPDSNEYFEIQLQKAGMLRGTITTKNLKKLDIIAHSEGAINSMIAVRKMPDVFEKIVLINPAGLIRKDNIFYLLFRLLRPEKRRELKAQRELQCTSNPFANYSMQKPKLSESYREKMSKITKELISNILINPFRLINEAYAISRSSIYKDLLYAKKIGKHVAIILSDNDKVVPEGRIRKDIYHEEKKAGQPIVDMLIVLKGEHSDLASDSKAEDDIDRDGKIEAEADEYVDQMIKILDELGGKTHG